MLRPSIRRRNAAHSGSRQYAPKRPLRQATKCRPKFIAPTSMKNTATISTVPLSKWPMLAS